MAIIFSAAYGGVGVMASALFILLYQGFFTLAGGWIAPPILGGDAGINELASVGGVLLMMIGFGLLDIRKTKTGNFLPAMIIAPPLLTLLAPTVKNLFFRGGLVCSCIVLEVVQNCLNNFQLLLIKFFYLGHDKLFVLRDIFSGFFTRHGFPVVAILQPLETHSGEFGDFHCNMQWGGTSVSMDPAGEGAAFDVEHGGKFHHRR